MSEDLIKSTDPDLVYLIASNSEERDIFLGSAEECMKWAQSKYHYASGSLNRLQLDPNFLFGPAHLLVNFFVNPRNYFKEFKESVYWKNAVSQGEYVGNESFEQVSSWVQEFVTLPMNILLRVEEGIGRKMVLELYNQNLMSKETANNIYSRLNSGDFNEYRFTEDNMIKRISRTYQSGMAED